MNLGDFISKALEEDLGNGDVTSLACIDENAEASAQLHIKSDGVLAGINLAERIFTWFDPAVRIHFQKNDGDPVFKGDIAFIVSGKTRTILACERLVLNCMQRMSGIATLTAEYVNRLSGLKTKVLDTRKTTPLFREMEKWAVRIGGGFNHRMGLYDMIMIKDNHIEAAGGIKQAIERVNKFTYEKRMDFFVEIEARNLKEVREILSTGNVNRIMLDNFSVEDLKNAVVLIQGKFETEASGGITLHVVRPIAETGVDFVSVGELTHSVKSLDMSLKIDH
jgi:nicotinate-nucleotide pyrophosphorylase (carboxylating)